MHDYNILHFVAGPGKQPEGEGHKQEVPPQQEHGAAAGGRSVKGSELCPLHTRWELLLSSPGRADLLLLLGSDVSEG